MVGICGIAGIGKTTIARAVYNSAVDNFDGMCFLHDIKENSSKLGLHQMQETMISKIVGVDIKIQDANEGVELIRMRLKQKKILLLLDNVDRPEHLEKLALNDEESLELLNWNAFRNNLVNPSHMMVLNCAINYAQGLPLALGVIGSNMCGRNINEWKSALDAFKLIPNKDIQQVLKVSYDGLEHFEKEIFPDIACFFRGESMRYVKYMMEAIHGFNNPGYSIGVLEDKCLIKIQDYYINMHDLIRDIGREIVHQESSNEPRKRTRLWFHEDIVHVLEDNTNSDNLSVFNLRGCQYITVIPNLSNLRNLKELVLEDCENLVEIHDLVGYLVKLEILDANHSVWLKTFPRYLKLPSLEELSLDHCSSLGHFLQIPEKMEVNYLSLGGTRIEKLPWSICKLTQLGESSIGKHKRIELPMSIFLLPKLEVLSVYDGESLLSYNHEEAQE
ncbi:TMV resistance protein N-like [Prosopis cineraria]|uniref:TMV resistance protein N-like n=1 Tax=Prosopis cineraria TaxID=364024 RepID=UPI0024101ADC|nr:TMV resistance protein N-like [Prosopis cineraria]